MWGHMTQLDMVLYLRSQNCGFSSCPGWCMVFEKTLHLVLFCSLFDTRHVAHRAPVQVTSTQWTKWANVQQTLIPYKQIIYAGCLATCCRTIFLRLQHFKIFNYSIYRFTHSPHVLHLSSGIILDENIIILSSNPVSGIIIYPRIWHKDGIIKWLTEYKIHLSSWLMQEGRVVEKVEGRSKGSDKEKWRMWKDEAEMTSGDSKERCDVDRRG